MKRKYLILAPICAMALSACSLLGKAYEPKDYFLDLEFKSGRILQLTDTHIGDKDDQEKHFKFMDLTINEAKANGGLDLIIITGDVFTFASRGTAQRMFAWLDSHEVPWTLTWGNHDEQCYFSIDWVTSYLNGLNDDENSYCVFKDLQDDKIHGNANFAINMKKAGEDKIFEQLIVMDSNRYNFKGYFGYDYFKQDQIDWYSDLVDYTTEQNGGVAVPSLMFYHIPLPEVNDAIEANKDIMGGDNIQNEDTCPPKYNSGFFEVIENKKSTTAMFFGHDHINKFCLPYHGVDFVYGVKSTDRIYYNEDLLGGQVITIGNDHKTTVQQIYHAYSEVK